MRRLRDAFIVVPLLCFARIRSALKIVRFPAATGGLSKLSLHPRAPKIAAGEPRALYLCISGWRNPDVFTTLGWFGLGCPIVPVVQPSQSHRHPRLFPAKTSQGHEFSSRNRVTMLQTYSFETHFGFWRGTAFSLPWPRSCESSVSPVSHGGTGPVERRTGSPAAPRR
jgi:hypothetical protein